MIKLIVDVALQPLKRTCEAKKSKGRTQDVFVLKVWTIWIFCRTWPLEFSGDGGSHGGAVGAGRSLPSRNFGVAWYVQRKGFHCFGRFLVLDTSQLSCCRLDNRNGLR